MNVTKNSICYYRYSQWEYVTVYIDAYCTWYYLVVVYSFHEKIMKWTVWTYGIAKTDRKIYLKFSYTCSKTVCNSKTFLLYLNNFLNFEALVKFLFENKSCTKLTKINFKSIHAAKLQTRNFCVPAAHKVITT